jgi:type II secretory pathway component PulJ
VPLTRILRRLRREESGFTLVEVLVACSLGTVILLASFMMLDSSAALTGRVTENVDRTQRARFAMAQITRDLRSQVCPSVGTAAIVDGQDSSVTFYAFLGTGAFVPDKFQILWDAGTNSIIEKKWAGSGAAPNTTWTSPPTQRTLLADVKPTPSSAPVFAYYATGAASPFTTPLSAANAISTSKVTITFLTYPSGKSSGTSITMQNEVFSRTSDPSGTTGTTSPECA